MNTPKNNSGKRSVCLAGFAGGAMALWWFRTPLGTFFSALRDQQAVSAFVQQFGVVGPAVLFALLVAQVFFAVLPGQALMLAAGYLYGFSTGVLVAGAGTILGGQLTFCLARWGGRSLVNRLASPRLVERWDRLATQQGGLFFFFTFVLPLFPSDLMSYIAGLGKVSSRKFFFANFFGRLPCAIWLALVGAYGFKLPFQLYIAAGVGLGIAFIAWLVYARRSLKDSDLGTASYAAALGIVKGYINIFRLRCNISGTTALPAGPKILAANHPNATDAFFLPVALPEHLHLLVQGNLFTLPFLGWLLSRSGQIPVLPDCRQKAFEQACELLRQGHTILIFPEAKLNPERKPVQAGTGAVRMSIATGAPVIPIGIHVADRDVWCISHRTKKGVHAGRWQVRGCCYFHFGERWDPSREFVPDDAPSPARYLTGMLMEKIHALTLSASQECDRDRIRIKSDQPGSEAEHFQTRISLPPAGSGSVGEHL